MTNKDLAVGAVGAFKDTSPVSVGIPGIPNGPPAKMVTSYLVKILPDLGSKLKTYRMFIALDQVAFNNDFIHVKGFFSDSTEDDIVTGYKELIASATATQITEMWIPWHTIHSVKSLVFKTASKK